MSTAIKNTKKNFITEIFEHDISWFVDSPKVTELGDGDIDYIEQQIGTGFHCGDLCIAYGENHDKEARGKWHLINWKNIALELYNVTGSDVNAAKARNLFEENWS